MAGVEEGGGELVEADGFAEVVVHAGGEAKLAVAVDGVGGEGDDPGVAVVGVASAQLAGGLEAVHLGHLDVEEDDVEGGAGGDVEHLESIADDLGLVAKALEEEGDDAFVDEVILGNKDAEGALGGDGVMANGGGRRGRRTEGAGVDECLVEGGELEGTCGECGDGAEIGRESGEVVTDDGEEKDGKGGG